MSRERYIHRPLRLESLPHLLRTCHRRYAGSRHRMRAYRHRSLRCSPKRMEEEKEKVFSFFLPRSVRSKVERIHERHSKFDVTKGEVIVDLKISVHQIGLRMPFRAIHYVCESMIISQGRADAERSTRCA